MLKQVEEPSPTTRKLKVDIPSSVIEKEIKDAFDKLRTTARVPGFRTGKIPQTVLEKKFGKDIRSRVLEKIVPEFYSEAVREAQISPITFPEIEGNFDLIKDQPLSFTATVEIKPDIKNLAYEGIILNKKTYSIEEPEIDSAIQSLRESKAVLRVTDGPINTGDLAVIDCDASVNEEQVPEISSRNYPFILGSPSMPKEFSDSFSGKKAGDSFDARIQFGPDIANKKIAGREVRFKISIKEMKERVIPPFDNDLAKEFQCASTEELRNKIRETIEKQKKSSLTGQYKKEIIEHLTGTHDFEIPQSLVIKEIDFQIKEARQDMMKTEETLHPNEELEKKLEPIARKNVKEMLIIDAIGKKEKIDVSEADMKEAIDGIAVQHGMEPEQVKKLYMLKDGSLTGLRHGIYVDKVLDLILSRSVIK